MAAAAAEGVWGNLGSWRLGGARDGGSAGADRADLPPPSPPSFFLGTPPLLGVHRASVSPLLHCRCTAPYSYTPLPPTACPFTGASRGAVQGVRRPARDGAAGEPGGQGQLQARGARVAAAAGLLIEADAAGWTGEEGGGEGGREARGGSGGEEAARRGPPVAHEPCAGRRRHYAAHRSRRARRGRRGVPERGASAAAARVTAAADARRAVSCCSAGRPLPPPPPFTLFSPRPPPPAANSVASRAPPGTVGAWWVAPGWGEDGRGAERLRERERGGAERGDS